MTLRMPTGSELQWPPPLLRPLMMLGPQLRLQQPPLQPYIFESQAAPLRCDDLLLKREQITKQSDMLPEQRAATSTNSYKSVKTLALAAKAFFRRHAALNSFATTLRISLARAQGKTKRYDARNLFHCPTPRTGQQRLRKEWLQAIHMIRPYC